MQNYPYAVPQRESTFGADPPPTVPDIGGSIVNIASMATLLTPTWLKEAVTISIGVFGGMALFRMFQRKLPGPQ